MANPNQPGAPVPFALYPPLPSASATINPNPPATNPTVNPLGITGPYLFVVDQNGNVYPGQLNAQPGSGVSGMFIEVVQSCVAAGANQAGATQCTGQTIKVTGGTGGIALPLSIPGMELMVINRSGAAIQVYGYNNGVDTIDAAPYATGVLQMSNSLVIYTCPVAGEWDSEGLATGFDPSVGLQTLSSVDALVAHAGGGQPNALLLLNMINRIGTVASANDSVRLQPAVPGENVVVMNGGAGNSMNVFPSSQAQGGIVGGDAINALGANNAFAMAQGAISIFYCWTAGQWFTK
jgi:hypothetical protein